MTEAPLDRILRLERAWRAEDPKRASGGEAALAGFHYQFAVAVRDVVRRFCDFREAAEADPSVLVEALHDVTTIDGDRGTIQITEVKRTARKDSVRAALDSFVQIDHLARRMDPPVGEVRYEILVGRGDLTTARAWVRDWAHENQYVRKGVVKRVRVEHRPDPRSEALAILANELRAQNPVETFDRMVGRLFSGASEGSGFVAAADELWSLLLDAVRDLPRIDTAYIWTETDRQPDTVRRGRVLTGSQPTVADLADGAFAPRPALTEQLTRVVREWIGETESSRRVPVLFITGRSGSGKSVVLLQLLERIHREFGGPVLLASPVAGDLGATVAWSQRLAGGERCVIGLDTVGPAPSRADWRPLVDALHVDRQRGTQLPILVTAGSPRQALSLDERYPDDLDVRTVAMPAETDSDLEALARWFARRTGSEPERTEANGRPLVWIVFEWSFGDLRDFSLRLRSSIDAFDASGTVRQLVTDLLVANTLGLALPHGALEERLSADDLHELASMLRSGSASLDDESLGGIWLAHPAVGREMYRHWAGSAGQRERTQDVERAAIRIIENGEAPAVQQVVRILYQRWRAAHLASGPLAGVDWLSVMAEVYPLVVAERDGDVSLDELHIWIGVNGQRSLDTPDPVAQALSWLVPQNADRAGITAAVEAILAEPEAVPATARAELAEALVRLLDQRREIRDWPRIAGATLQALDAPTLRPLLAEWLKASHAGRPEGWLLGAALERFPDDAPLREVADAVLSQPTLRSWPLVWNGVWNVDPSEVLAERGIRWLGRSSYDDRSWAWIWKCLWESPRSLVPARSDLAALGRRYLTTASARHSGWVHVFNAMWTTGRHDELRPLGYDWAANHEHHAHGGWPWLWETLWDDSGRNVEALRSHAADWLSVTPETPRWGVVYRKLLEQEPSSELIDLGLIWLDLGPPGHYDWGYVFPAVWNAVTDVEVHERLYQRGTWWFAEAPDAHFGRPSVFDILIRHRDTPRLREDAERWLDRVMSSHFAWGLVWEALGGPRDESARERAIRFLRDALPSHAGHQAWARVWRLMSDHKKSDELVLLGRTWLGLVSYDNPGRSYVQLPILHRAFGSPMNSSEATEVIDEAMAWIRETDQWDGGGHIVWERLLMHGPTELVPELIEIGTAALDMLPKHTRGWADVWARLWGHAPTDELTVRANEWLNTAPADSPGWPIVLKFSAPSQQMDDANLRATALALLEQPVVLPEDARRFVSMFRAAVDRYASVRHDPDAATTYRVPVIIDALVRGVLDDARDDIGLRTKLASDAGTALLTRGLDVSIRSRLLRVCSEPPADRIDEVLQFELAIQRAHRHLTTASALVAAAGRAGSHAVAVDVLRWATEQLEKEPGKRSLETLATASRRLTDRVALEATDPAVTELVDRARQATSDLRSEVPAGSGAANQAGANEAGGALEAIRRRWRALFAR